MLVCLLILTITFFLLTLYSVLQANSALFHLEASPFLSLKILDTSSAASLFVTLLGALLVRHQFALGLLPRINYKSAKTTRQNPQDSGEPFTTWRVELRNTGLGSAIINRADYRLELAGATSHCHFHTFDAIIRELAKIDWVRDRDYWIENINAGFSLSPKDDCFLFEIKTEHIAKLKRLDVALYFQGQLGDRYRRDISLIPRF